MGRGEAVFKSVFAGAVAAMAPFGWQIARSEAANDPSMAIPMVVFPLGALMAAGWAIQGGHEAIQAHRESSRLRRSARREAVAKVRDQLTVEDRRTFEAAGYFRPAAEGLAGD